MRKARHWPDRELHLFGAGLDSGTYDYFAEAIVGKARSSRPGNGEGPIAPSAEAVRAVTYQPLSRPLLVYLARPR
jgi:ABC-type phosphate transport system substrate-binding protein